MKKRIGNYLEEYSNLEDRIRDNLSAEQAIHDVTLRQLAFRELDCMGSENDMTVEIMTAMPTVYRYPIGSQLDKDVRDFYKTLRAMPEHNIRAYFERDGYIYFVVGGGYDVLDKDLLNGDGDGSNAQRFAEEYGYSMEY